MTKGPRPKFDATRKEFFCNLLRNGIRRGNACKKAGITRVTFNVHLNRYPQFAADVMQAEIDANELVEQSLFNTALKGNVTAQQVWLYNRDPDRWQDKRNITLGGDKNNPVRVEWEGTRLAILGAVDDDPEAKQRIIEALERRRRDPVHVGPSDLG